MAGGGHGDGDAERGREGDLAAQARPPAGSRSESLLLLEPDELLELDGFDFELSESESDELPPKLYSKNVRLWRMVANEFFGVEEGLPFGPSRGVLGAVP